MRSKVKAMEKFVTGLDAWLVNGMCLVASYLWHRLWDVLCYERRHRASTPPASQFTSLLGPFHRVDGFGLEPPGRRSPGTTGFLTFQHWVHVTGVQEIRGHWHRNTLLVHIGSQTEP
ncbi:unnamed protein product [Pleuronectes platessa]|uniref:Uncharacterized protein n=1 Tax=Pleuronectes platessa TaxID=8262 RepID=A0A9N7Z4F6_PLEPL|nr:unnamed protein product [Pleuronectes platessa]